MIPPMRSCSECGHAWSAHDTGWDASGCMLKECACRCYREVRLSPLMTPAERKEGRRQARERTRGPAKRVMELEQTSGDLCDCGWRTVIAGTCAKCAGERAEKRVAELERALKSMVKDGCGFAPRACPARSPDPEDWCWSCQARAALAAAKGE